MESYRCVVYDDSNKRKILNLDFKYEEDVLKYAKENNLRVSSIKKRNSIFNFSKESKKLKDKELKILCNQMGILFESGCEITRLLEILKSLASKKLKNIIDRILKGIREGNGITESFKNANAFSTFFLSMVEAGEISSNLDDTMFRLSEYYDKEARLKSNMLVILIYPIILAIMTIFMVVAILVFIMPKYEQMYIQNNVELPVITKVMIFLSHFLINNFMIILVVLFTLILITVYVFKNNKELRTEIFKLSLRLPIIGKYRVIQITNRFSKSMHILIKSGVQIITAIDISAKIIDNEYIYDMLSIANDAIREGNGIGASLSKINLFPALFITMITVGESTGKLDASLDTVNKFYENELDEMVKIGMKYLEIGVILLMALVIGATIVSMVIPMFNAISSF